VGIAPLWILAALVVLIGGCRPVDARPSLGELVPDKGIVIGLADIGPERWTVHMRANDAEICTLWELENGASNPALGDAWGCGNQWTSLIAAGAPPVFVQLMGGFSGPGRMEIEGLAGDGLARVELDYGTGVITPPLVDLAPISRRGRAFAIAVPGRVEIAFIRGFDAEGRQVLSMTP
jgi:hypothetical protein